MVVLSTRGGKWYFQLNSCLFPGVVDPKDRFELLVDNKDQEAKENVLFGHSQIGGAMFFIPENNLVQLESVTSARNRGADGDA